MRGKVVTVNGAADGIGYAVAEAMCEVGADVSDDSATGYCRTKRIPPTIFSENLRLMVRVTYQAAAESL